jgi:hypothetical protein
LVFHGFLGEGELFDVVSLKRNENDVYEGRVPSGSGLVDNKIANHSGIVISFRSQNFVAIMLR